MRDIVRNGLIGLLAALVTSCTSPEPPGERAARSAAVVVGSASATPASTEPSTKKGGRDISSVDRATGAISRLVSAPGSQHDAELSPDGRQLVFESRASGQRPQIFVLEADGTERQLTQMPLGASEPAWSPDGTRIAFAGTRRGPDGRSGADIFVMRADGSHIRRLVGTIKNDGHPDWSPDGSRIVFHSRYVGASGIPGGLIRVASVRTGIITRLTRSHTAWAEVDPAWSPDGRSIAFSRCPRSTINGETPWARLFFMRPNGERVSHIGKSDSYGHMEDPSWSPDGRSIVVQGGPSVGVIELGAERLRTILTGAPSAEPSWGVNGITVSMTPAAAASLPQVQEPGWVASWEPSWVGRPDATIVLNGTRCRQDGDARVLDPGALVFSLVNEAKLEGLFRVARLAPGQGLSALWIEVPPYFGRRSSVFCGHRERGPGRASGRSPPAGGRSSVGRT